MPTRRHQISTCCQHQRRPTTCHYYFFPKQRANTLTNVNPQTDFAIKAQAKQLVQLRKQKEKLYETKAQLSSVGMQATAMTSQVSAITAVGSVTAALTSANSAMDATKMGQTMAEFSRQNKTAKVKEELLNDALVERSKVREGRH